MQHRRPYLFLAKQGVFLANDVNATVEQSVAGTIRDKPCMIMSKRCQWKIFTKITPGQ